MSARVRTRVPVHVCVWGLYSLVAPGSGDTPSAVPCPTPAKETQGHLEASPAELSMWSGAVRWDVQGHAQGTAFAQPGEHRVKRRFY